MNLSTWYKDKLQVFKTLKQSLKRVVLILFVLSALIPCTTKIFALEYVGVQYERPYHPTKTTVQNHSCSNLTLGKPELTSAEKINVLSKPGRLSKNSCFNILLDRLSSIDVVENKLGQLPPKYILFKRLKISLL